MEQDKIISNATALNPSAIWQIPAEQAVLADLEPPYSSHREQAGFADSLPMTVADFVETHFVPGHVAQKGVAGRTHYQAMLKHILAPEEVRRIFHAAEKSPRTKLKAVPGWPYITALPLSEVGTRHVEELIAAALSRGYSPQTVTHIRNVVSAIYAHAHKVGSFNGSNPAAQVSLPGMSRKTAHSLSLAETKSIIELMRHPEREMTLVAILTDLNVAEICGMQWKHLNLTDREIESEGVSISAHSIAVQKQWYRGQQVDVKGSRARQIAIPASLLPVLIKLSLRLRHTGPEDFVFVSQAGTPVNETNIASRRLKIIGEKVDMPWLSWQVIRRTHKSLLAAFGADFEKHFSLSATQ